MKKLVLALLLAFVLPVAAHAQDDEAAPAETPSADAAADEAAQSDVNYVNRNFGAFSLDLPAHGTLLTPDSPEWTDEEQVVFNWVGNDDDPIVHIVCRIDSFEDELEQETYDKFCEALLANWLSNEQDYTVLDPPKPRMEDDPRQTRSTLGTHVWNLIQIDDRSNANGGNIYYSIFSTWSGSNIYTLSFYYFTPMTKENATVRNFGKPILESFRIAGESAAAPAADDMEAGEDAA